MAEINENISFDAQVTSEAIAAGEQKAPQVDVDKDYERSKEFDVSEIDRTPEGAKAAEVATSPQLDVPGASIQGSKSAATGDPEEFLEMAKEANPNL